MIICWRSCSSLQWLHKQSSCQWFEMPWCSWYEHHGISNYWQLDCLCNSWYRLIPEETSKLGITDHLWGEPPMTSRFHSQRASISGSIFYFTHYDMTYTTWFMIHTQPFFIITEANNIIQLSWRDIIVLYQIMVHQIKHYPSWSCPRHGIKSSYHLVWLHITQDALKQVDLKSSSFWYHMGHLGIKCSHTSCINSSIYDA